MGAKTSCAMPPAVCAARGRFVREAMLRPLAAHRAVRVSSRPMLVRGLRRAFLAASVVALLAACGGKGASRPATTAAPTTPLGSKLGPESESEEAKKKSEESQEESEEAKKKAEESQKESEQAKEESETAKQEAEEAREEH